MRGTTATTCNRSTAGIGAARGRVAAAAAALTVATVTSALLTSPAFATRTASSPLVSCGSVKGAGWVFPGTGGKLKGTTYGVTAVRTACSFAKQWAVKLSGRKLAGKTPGKSYPVAGGPQGYACTANPDANGKLLAASCRKGAGTAKSAFSFGGRPAGAPTG